MTILKNTISFSSILAALALSAFAAGCSGADASDSFETDADGSPVRAKVIWKKTSTKMHGVLRGTGPRPPGGFFGGPPAQPDDIKCQLMSAQYSFDRADNILNFELCEEPMKGSVHREKKLVGQDLEQLERILGNIRGVPAKYNGLPRPSDGSGAGEFFEFVQADGKVDLLTTKKLPLRGNADPRFPTWVVPDFAFSEFLELLVGYDRG